MSTKINSKKAKLEKDRAIGTFDQCLERKDIKGSFDNFKFAVSNCRQIVLNHQNLYRDKDMGSIAKIMGNANTVFVMNEEGKNRKATTWEELRDYLKQGWFVGTKKTPGIKFSFIGGSRKNYRRDASRILVFRDKA